MARFVIKTLAVAALVCLVVDWSRAADTQQQEPAGTDTLGGAKDKVTDFMNSVKQSATQAFNTVKESENTKKVESQLSNFFSGAMNKLKSTFSSKPTNADDANKQEAVKAFNDYAEKIKP